MSASSSTQPRGERLAALDRAALGLLLELRDDLRRRRRADVGHDQRLLQALPGLVVERLEQRRLDLGAAAPDARLGQVLAQAAEEPAALLGLGARRAAATAAPSAVRKTSDQSRGMAVGDDSGGPRLRTPRPSPMPRAAARARRRRSPRCSPSSTRALRADRRAGRADGHARADSRRRAARSSSASTRTAARSPAAGSSGSTTAPRDQAHVRRAAGARAGVARALLGALEDAARRLGYASPAWTPGRTSPTPSTSTARPATRRSGTSTRTRSRASGARSRWPERPGPAAGPARGRRDPQPVVVSGRWRPTWPT